ncbi:hypothetical protein L873DRAFT_455754 [Choiromyces venosus 120613-1]|uniref:Uncharacterized protein n=1 Tax=Choiromyces venosus 120613-1 TaxID=1336337 RepID=A0A3N4JVL6_9PEZI|nr:hypothetical protein L873DRAFT_455754 [Choiromyces venosus 120613-1]
MPDLIQSVRVFNLGITTGHSISWHHHAHPHAQSIAKPRSPITEFLRYHTTSTVSYQKEKEEEKKRAISRISSHSKIQHSYLAISYIPGPGLTSPHYLLYPKAHPPTNQPPHFLPFFLSSFPADLPSMPHHNNPCLEQAYRSNLPYMIKLEFGLRYDMTDD